MKLFRISDFTGGWIIGDFSPSILKTSAFEIGLLNLKKNEVWPSHYHQYCTEYNVLVNGRMVINDFLVMPGDVFILEAGEVAKSHFLDDCTILVVKIPSISGDKVLVDNL
jgi:quercetin dioxygenase-like cupin family protein